MLHRRAFLAVLAAGSAGVLAPISFIPLGDDRDQSRDSRMAGFVAREQIRGRVHVVYYSMAPGPSPFPRALTAARWSRIGERVR